MDVLLKYDEENDNIFFMIKGELPSKVEVGNVNKVLIYTDNSTFPVQTLDMKSDPERIRKMKYTVINAKVVIFDKDKTDIDRLVIHI